MIIESTTKIRTDFSEALNLVAYKGERIVLERHGKKVAVIIPIADYKLLEALEDRLDAKESEEILKNISNDNIIPWTEAKKELHK